jgi:hypothetical protein
MKTIIHTFLLLLTCFSVLQTSSQTAGLRENQMLATIESEEDEITLHWQTAREVNTSSFIIEKSTDGITYEMFASKRAAGSSMLPGNYEMNDLRDTAHKMYYRIILITMNGARIVSNTVTVEPVQGKEKAPEFKMEDNQPVVTNK